MISYEQQLANNPEWALNQGSLHFENRSAVQLAMRKIAQRLDELGITYAVAGGMALFLHGYRRFTEDVDLLVTKEGLQRIHAELSGRGYVTPFEKSKNLRDTDLGVRIEFLIAGQFPGDGLPKPIAFPDPSGVRDILDGLAVANLPTLIELKIASGISNAGRLKDLGDVQELIKLLNLPLDYAHQIDPYVQPKYKELWMAVNKRGRFILDWTGKLSPHGAKSIDDVLVALQSALLELEKMRADGVTMESRLGNAGHRIYLVTTDPAIARKYGMHDQADFMEE
jgi:hypothetical protein